jgi:hypothetical protein
MRMLEILERLTSRTPRPNDMSELEYLAGGISNRTFCPMGTVVDDDPDFVSYTRTVLESEGYSVVSAGNSDQGLRVLAQEKPDLVVLDVIMSSVLDGLSMSQRMAEDALYRHLPTPTTWRSFPPTIISTLMPLSPSRLRPRSCCARWAGCWQVIQNSSQIVSVLSPQRRYPRRDLWPNV